MLFRSVRSQSRGTDPLRPGAGVEPQRSGGRVAGDLRGAVAAVSTAVAAGPLLCAHLSQPRLELSPRVVAPARPRIGIAPLVRPRPGRNAAGTSGDAPAGGIAGRTARSDRAENLA